MFMWVSACKLLLKKNQNINAVVFIFFLLFFFPNHCCPLLVRLQKHNICCSMAKCLGSRRKKCVCYIKTGTVYID